MQTNKTFILIIIAAVAIAQCDDFCTSYGCCQTDGTGLETYNCLPNKNVEPVQTPAPTSVEPFNIDRDFNGIVPGPCNIAPISQVVTFSNEYPSNLERSIDEMIDLNNLNSGTELITPYNIRKFYKTRSNVKRIPPPPPVNKGGSHYLISNITNSTLNMFPVNSGVGEMLRTTNFITGYNESVGYFRRQIKERLFRGGLNLEEFGKQFSKRHVGSISGTLSNYLQFNAGTGDGVCGQWFLNGTGSGYLLSEPYYWSLIIEDILVIYPMSPSAVYGIDIDISTNCFCHCSWSPKTECNSNTNQCNKYDVCTNLYDSSVSDWTCPFNFQSAGTACCSVTSKPKTKVQSYKIGTPSGIQVKAKLTVYYDSEQEGAWVSTTTNIDVPFTTGINMYNFEMYKRIFSEPGVPYRVGNTNTIFTGFIAMNEISNYFGYQGRDVIAQDSSGVWRLLEGWEEFFNNDVSNPGWLKYDSVSSNAPIYNKNSLRSNVHMAIDTCLTDKFTIKTTIDKSDPSKGKNLITHLSQWGEPVINTDVGFLLMRPNTVQSVSFNMLLNVSGVVFTTVGMLESFNCTELTNNPVTINCSLQGFVGGGICFGLKTSEGQTVAISCGYPNEYGHVKLMYALSEKSGYSVLRLCANGFDSTPCASINITYPGNQTYDPNWVDDTNMTDVPVRPTKWDFFKDSSSWFSSLSDGFKTVGTFIGFAAALIITVMVAWLVLYMVIKTVKYISRSRKYKKLKKLRESKILDELNDDDFVM
jgi:hypothetical protein